MVSPGMSPGTLSITGNYVQGADGTLSVELGGTVPGTLYDVLNVSGNATLGGKLQVSLTGGFVPTTDYAFGVVKATGTVSTARLKACNAASRVSDSRTSTKATCASPSLTRSSRAP